MPKISSRQVLRVRDHELNINESFIVDTHYTKAKYAHDEPYFFVYLPPSQWAGYTLLTQQKKEELHSSTVWVPSKSEHVPITTGNTEAEAMNNMQELILVILKTDVVKRNVIILELDIIKGDNSWKSYSRGMELIGLHLGVFYAEEVKAGTAEPSYYVDRSGDEWNSPGRPTKRSLDLDMDLLTIIDDTPVNRVFIEELYSAFKVLVEKLEKHTKKPADLIKLIKSQTKLLQ